MGFQVFTAGFQGKTVPDMIFFYSAVCRAAESDAPGSSTMMSTMMNDCEHDDERL